MIWVFTSILFIGYVCTAIFQYKFNAAVLDFMRSTNSSIKSQTESIEILASRRP